MSEGNVYLCKWERKDDGYRVWVEKRPRLRAEGESLDEAGEELISLICLKTGDGEAVLEFERKTKGKDALVALSYNQSWYPARGEWWKRADELYEGGICSSCCEGIGKRTQVPLRVGTVEGGDLLFGWLGFCNSLIASDRFRKLLRHEERSAVEWRPVEHHKKTRRQFFELIPENAVRESATRGSDYGGWRCPECDRSALSVGGYDEIHVNAADVPRPRPKLFVVEGLVTFELVVPAARWKRMRGKPGTSGITTQTVVLVPPERALRRPRLPLLTRKQIASVRRHHKWQLKDSLVDRAQIRYELDGSVTQARSS